MEAKNFKCFICGQEEGIAEDFHSEIILDENRKVHIRGSLMDNNSETIAVCKGCLASLLFTAAGLYHEGSLRLDKEITFQQ